MFKVIKQKNTLHYKKKQRKHLKQTKKKKRKREEKVTEQRQIMRKIEGFFPGFFRFQILRLPISYP